jgi:hypothetical protein
MSAKRIVMIALGVTAAAWLSLSLHGVFHPPRAGPELAQIALETPARLAEVSDASAQPPHQPNTDPREPDSVAAQAPVHFEGSVDTPAWGRSFEECKTKKRVATSVCKHRFEPRDPNWAPEAEQRIRDFVADTGLLRLPDEADPAYHLECRATFCQVHLRVDRAGLTDRLRSIGWYQEGNRLAREHEFAYLTLLKPTSQDHRWAEDRAEELRLEFVLSGLLKADSSVAVTAVEPAYREQDSFLLLELSRCPDRNDVCAAQ